MKFAEHLSAHLTPEWRSQYIDYSGMKDILVQSMVKAEPFVDENDAEQRHRYFLRIDQNFFQFCDHELSKVNTFFAEKLAEALRRWEALRAEVQSIEKRRRQKLEEGSGQSSVQRTESRSRSSSFNNISEADKSIKLRHRLDPEQESKSKATVVRKLSERLVEKTREKYQQRAYYRNCRALKLAFSEFYLMLVLIQNYQMLNYTGFRKILKKHDKMFKTDRGEEWRKKHVDTAYFHKTKRIDQIIDDTEILYTETFEGGDRSAAMKRLRVPPLEEKQSSHVTFRVGLFFGMLCLLLPTVIALVIYLHDHESTKPLAWRQALFLYRSSLLVIVHVLLLGLNIYGWTSSGVNHVLIFEIDPRKHLTYQQYLETGTFLFVVWLISFGSFILASYHDFHPFVQPLGFISLLILLLFNPTPTMYRHSRFWLLRTLGRLFCAPFFRVGFADFWLADQLTSLELLFFDFETFVCFYSDDVEWWPVYKHDPNPSFLCSAWRPVFIQSIFMILPSWFRFAQCLRRYRDTKQAFPHLVNAGKYLTGFFVVTTNAVRRATAVHYWANPTSNPFLYLWILTTFIGSTYKCIWDLKMDWGLFAKKPGKNKYLRDQLIYSSRFFYYGAILLNVILRYIWIVNVFLQFRSYSAEYKDLIGFIFGLMEIFRRFIWNFFRLENEHLNNCGQFRAVRNISIVPISETFDSGTIEDMMDREVGIRNRPRSIKRESGIENDAGNKLSIIITDHSAEPTTMLTTPAQDSSSMSPPTVCEMNTTTTLISSTTPTDHPSPEPVL